MDVDDFENVDVEDFHDDVDNVTNPIYTFDLGLRDLSNLVS